MRGGRREVEAEGSHEGRGVRVRTSWKWGEEVSWQGSSLTQREASHHSRPGEGQGQETPGPVHRLLGHQPLQTLRPLISEARPRPLPGDRSAAWLGCCCRRYSWCRETVRASGTSRCAWGWVGGGDAGASELGPRRDQDRDTGAPGGSPVLTCCQPAAHLSPLTL